MTQRLDTNYTNCHEYGRTRIALIATKFMKRQSGTTGVRTVEPSCKFVKFVSQSIRV